MKLFHLSDLHIGKLLSGYSLRENQERVLSPDRSLCAGGASRRDPDLRGYL